MKHFVYLDTDLINSYLAQLNDGLINLKQEESGASVTEAKGIEDTPFTDNTSIGINIPGIFKYDHNLHSEYFKEVSTISQTNAGREILSKIIHDNSYDNLINYLNKEKNIKKHKDSGIFQVGDYIEITNNFRMVDLSVISDVFDESFKDVYSYMIKNEFNLDR